MEFLLLVMIFVNVIQMILLAVIFCTKQQYCVHKVVMISEYREYYSEYDLDYDLQYQQKLIYDEYVQKQYDEYMEAMYQEHLEYEWRFNYDGAPGEFIILCA